MTVSKESIIALLHRNDATGMHAVGRALLVLWHNQTSDERVTQHTNHDNGIGFTVSDAKRGCGMAEFYKSAGKLTPKQVAYWTESRTASGRPRIDKYWGQLLKAAQAKQVERQTAA